MTIPDDKDFFELPDIIQFLYIQWLGEMPVGASTYEKAIKEYPEYFPEEVEYRRKWNAIPQAVKDQYNKESGELFQAEQEANPSKGLLYYCQHPEEWEERSTIYEEFSKKEDELFNKHFSKYGLTR